jgi:hypothetical protein
VVIRADEEMHVMAMLRKARPVISADRAGADNRDLWPIVYHFWGACGSM